MPEVIIHEKARLDVEEQAAFLKPQAVELASRFLEEFGQTVERLLRFPNLGRVWPTRNPSLAGLRRLSVTSFPLSIFYRPGRGAIEIIRVLHHSRDLPPELQDL